MRQPEDRPSPLDTSHEHEVLLRPLHRTGTGWYFLVAALASVVVWAAYAYSCQFRSGLGVTGLNRPIFWGIYIINFVFFIGISHAGTLISAILRVTSAEWRRPITRIAEAITVFALFTGMSNIFLDMGRPDRVLNVLRYGKLHSPILWDVCCVSVYLTGSIIYLYLPLIPDLARCRDTLQDVSPFKRWFYGKFSVGWTGAPQQMHRLEKAIGIMAIGIIPVAVSVHTVVSWIFAMTIQPMWHSTIFGPYFVVGAIFSGIAVLIIAMALLRKALHLEPYLKPIHFNQLGLLLLTMCCLWTYFTFAEYLTTFYGAEPDDMTVFVAKLAQEFDRPFWVMVLCCFVAPFSILVIPKGRSVAGCVVASSFISIGMWLERFTIVVPTLSRPRLPYQLGIYHPTWVEWSLMAGEFAFFTLLYVLFVKLFPIVSIWELDPAPAHAPEVAPHEDFWATFRKEPRPRSLPPLVGGVVLAGIMFLSWAVTRPTPRQVPREKLERPGEMAESLGQLPVAFAAVQPRKPRSHRDGGWKDKHGGVARKDMAECRLCHDEWFCQKCHRTIRPQSHTQSRWLASHPAAARGHTGYCQGCHGASFCADCHQKLAHGVAWISVHPTAAATERRTCLQCHTSASQSSFCQKCHEQRPPESHQTNWLSVHPGSARAQRDKCMKCHEASFCEGCHRELKHGTAWVKKHPRAALQARAVCARCHEERFCNDCHQVEMPHPSEWRATGHQPAAQRDAARCAKCHQTSFCLNCHQKRPPSSHDASWRKTHPQAAKANASACATCHGKDGCRKCHKTDMPHPSDWTLEKHKNVASFREDSFCLHCHEQKFCSICHVKQEGSGDSGVGASATKEQKSQKDVALPKRD